MADRIKFYKQNRCIVLDRSEKTQNFSKCFDTLNRKYATKEIRKDSSDFKLITFTLIPISFSHYVE